jgi:hypothetical protein
MAGRQLAPPEGRDDRAAQDVTVTTARPLKEWRRQAGADEHATGGQVRERSGQAGGAVI